MYDTIRRIELLVSVDASGTPIRPWSYGRAQERRPRNANWALIWVARRCRLEKGTQQRASIVSEGTGFSKGLRIGCPGGGDAWPGTSNGFVNREPWIGVREAGPPIRVQ